MCLLAAVIEAAGAGACARVLNFRYLLYGS